MSAQCLRLMRRMSTFKSEQIMISRAAHALLDIVRGYHTRGIRIHFVRVKKPSRVWDMFFSSGIVVEVGPEHMFRRIGEAMDWIREEGDSNVPQTMQRRTNSDYVLNVETGSHEEEENMDHSVIL